MRNRYEALDGLRGVAALGVLGCHIQAARHDAGWFVGGYLAVDFFFLLSGFVIGAAYEHRFAAGLSFRSYAGVRLRRLYPTMALGAVLGLGLALAGWYTGVNPWVALVMQLAYVPFLGVQAFALNGVQWSLLLELIANGAHAAARRWLTTPRLVVVVLIGAAAVAGTYLYFDTLMVGWKRTDWLGGLARVGFSFPLGLLIWRLHRDGRLPRTSAPLPLVALCLGGLLAMPDPPALLCVFAAFPLLLLAGVNQPPRPRPVSRLAGFISYPLYAIHLPLISAAGVFAPAAWAGPYWAGVVGIVLALSWAVGRFYEPMADRLLALMAPRYRAPLAP